MLKNKNDTALIIKHYTTLYTVHTSNSCIHSRLCLHE